MQPLFAYQPEGLITIVMVGLILAFTMPFFEATGLGKWISIILASCTAIVLFTVGRLWIIFKDRQRKKQMQREDRISQMQNSNDLKDS